MHLLLTDRLVCPRCGPPFGLILLADRVEDRRVLEGRLGCMNCRETYPVTGGFADVRFPPRRPLDREPPFPPTPPEETLRLAALLGVAEGPGEILLAGAAAAHAEALTGLVSDVEVVALGQGRLAERPERDRVSRLAAGPGLPFHSGMLRGVALGGEAAGDLLEEAARVVAPLARVVVQGAPPGSRPRLEAAGLQAVLEEDGVVVAVREGGGGRR